MRASLAFLLAVSAAVGIPLLGGADERHQHSHAGEEKLGTVDFPVSCAAAAKTKFTRAAALLHSFAYEEAEKGFADVLSADPSCAMAHWGIAMSLFHPIWAAANPAGAPSPAEIQRGAEAVRKAASGHSRRFCYVRDMSG